MEEQVCVKRMEGRVWGTGPLPFLSASDNARDFLIKALTPSEPSLPPFFLP